MDNDNRIVRIEDKIDHIKDAIGQINITLAAQHESLKEHMHRTELLEKSIIPINDHMILTKAVLKIAGSAGMLIGLAAAVAEILGYFKHH